MTTGGVLTTTVGGVKRNALASVPLFVPTVTLTSVLPAACAGVFAVIVVLFVTATSVAGEPPMSTVAPDWKPVPLIVTAVPPNVVPLLGEMDVTVTDVDPGPIGPSPPHAAATTHAATAAMARADPNSTRKRMDLNSLARIGNAWK